MKIKIHWHDAETVERYEERIEAYLAEFDQSGVSLYLKGAERMIDINYRDFPEWHAMGFSVTA